jgi:hypothetical protein
MNRNDLSKPPSDDALMAHVLDDAFGRVPPGGVISMSTLMGETLRQLPGALSRERIRAAVLDRATRSGFVIDFDERHG